MRRCSSPPLLTRTMSTSLSSMTSSPTPQLAGVLPHRRWSHKRHYFRRPSDHASPSPVLSFTHTHQNATPTLSRSERPDIAAILKNYSAMLRDFSSNGSLRDGMTVHGRVVRSGLNPDMHLWISLVNMYCKCGRLSLAGRVFDKMPQRDVAAWTTMIFTCIEEGDGFGGVLLFSEMHEEGVLPNDYAVVAGLKACSACSDLEFGRQVHAEAIKLGFLSDTFVGSSLVLLYVKCGELELAEDVLFDLPSQNDVALVALFGGYAQGSCEGNYKVLMFFQKVTDLKTRLSQHILSVVLKCCGLIGDINQGRMFHSLVIKRGSASCILGSCLVDMYSKCGSVEDAMKAFERIKDSDVVAWSSMLSCLEQQGHALEATELFVNMGRHGILPNQFTLSSLASAAAEVGDKAYCSSVHAFILKLGWETHNIVVNALVHMYMNNGAKVEAHLVFNNLVLRDSFSWNNLLSGYHSGNDCKEGLFIFKQMLDEGFKPNKYTFISILRSCTSLLYDTQGSQIHSYIIKNNLHKDQHIATGLIDMYASCGHLDKARTLFERMTNRDVFPWTVMISDYTRAGEGEVALRCFRNMKQTGVSPNEFTFASSFRACSSLGALETGSQIHSHIIKSGLCDDAFVSNALIDMYGKCGCLKEAEEVFDSSIVRDTVLWNTMICFYSQHGYAQKALEAFQHMSASGHPPDEVTFIGILSACSFARLIDEGRKYFNSLTEKYRITPTTAHYACMVDLLSRAGNMEETKKFIEDMPFTPDALIWQTVLNACRVHGNIELGERAAEKLIELDPNTDTTYVLSSNMYATAKRWNDVSRIRNLMSSRGIKKEPGCSWVNFSGQTHVFLPCDFSHPKSKEIFLKLEELTSKLTLAGYSPDLEQVLHDVDITQKRKSLLYHSERLALCYSLISTKSGRTVRIFKNLRICGDCHNAIKIISSFVNREIVIRDISRFHHFKNGSCSCCDKW